MWGGDRGILTADFWFSERPLFLDNKMETDGEHLASCLVLCMYVKLCTAAHSHICIIHTYTTHMNKTLRVTKWSAVKQEILPQTSLNKKEMKKINQSLEDFFRSD